MDLADPGIPHALSLTSGTAHYATTLKSIAVAEHLFG
jgi:hypothetical protein